MAMKTGEKVLVVGGLAMPVVAYGIHRLAQRQEVGMVPGAGGALPQDRTWPSITVEAAVAPPTGELDQVVVWDRTNNVTHAHPPTPFPVRLAPNTLVRAVVRGRNTTARTVRLQVQVHLLDPGGTLRGYHSHTADVPSGAHTIAMTQVDVPLDRTGTWKIRGVLKQA